MKGVVHNGVSALREKTSFTQEELARRLGVTRQTIHALERGNYTPSVLLALRLASVFKTTVEKLFWI